MSRHLVFYGNPGTGKTTMARLLARIYKSLGILGRGQLVETDRSGLVAGYVGQTALKVREVVQEAIPAFCSLTKPPRSFRSKGKILGKRQLIPYSS